jgi:hypothetical protein
MSAEALLRDLRARGVSVSADGADLVLDGPVEELTDELVTQLRAAKAELLGELKFEAAMAWQRDIRNWAPGVAEAVKSNALIWAEEPPCPGFRRGQWERIRHNIARFKTTHAVEATRLGWTAVDLYGVHPTVGVARVDCCGALIIAKAPVVSVTAEAITYANGLTFYRKPRAGPSVPVWEFGV